MAKIIKENRLNVREKVLEHGISFPFDEELIMLILGSGTKDMPVDLLSKKIHQVLIDSNCEDIVENLTKIKGVGVSKALAVAAALELGRRYYTHLRAVIRTPNDLIPFIRRFAVNNREHFLVVTLNGGHEIIQIRVASVGTLNRTIIHPREIFSEAIKENAAAIIVCHNHPSGNCSPSQEDIETTQILISASKIIGIELLDHIIIDCENYFSFVEHDVLFSE